MPRITVSVPDYSKLVEDCAEEVGATVVDIRSEQAWNEESGQIMLTMLNGYSPEDGAFANVKTKKVYVALPITTERGYAIAMHELGHIAKTPVGADPTVESESIATQWALEHFGIKIGREGAEILQMSVDSYLADPELGKPGPVTKHVQKELHNLLQQA